MRRWRRYGTGRHVQIKALVLIAMCLGFMVLLNHQLRPIIESITTNEARIKSINTINKAVAEELSANGVSYDNLVSVERNDSGKVLAITTNMIKMNELKAAVIMDVQNRLGDDSHSEVGVPLGTLLGNDLLHGRGPNVPLKLTLSGNVTADFKSSFESAGINQTKHQIYLDIHTSVYSFIPGFNTTTEVETNIPVAETIIVGEVPQMLANFK